VTIALDAIVIAIEGSAAVVPLLYWHVQIAVEAALGAHGNTMSECHERLLTGVKLGNRKAVSEFAGFAPLIPVSGVSMPNDSTIEFQIWVHFPNWTINYGSAWQQTVAGETFQLWRGTK